MMGKRRKVSEWSCSVLFLMVILWSINFAEAQTIGKTIDKNNYKEYNALLIPAMARAVEMGDLILPTANLDFPYKHWDRFLNASEKNAGKFDVNEKGNLIDNSTGKIPKFNIHGFPFPKIDPKDPRVADKIMWNFNFQKYRFMGELWNTSYHWIGKGEIGEERYVRGPTYFLYFQGRMAGHEMKNPRNFLYCELITITEPMSMKGTNNMAWEFFDEREISQFAYIPAIRRTRQLSGVSRSDPYMGSDGWFDLDQGWAGKNTTMKWKFAGERVVLAPFTKTTKDVAEESPDGSLTWKPPLAKFGYRTKGWSGAPWVITMLTYVPRPVWVIEQMPLNPYYNWGLHINYVDKETYVIWQKEVYTRAGEFRTWVSNVHHYSEAPSGNNTVGKTANFHITDTKVRHASVSQSYETRSFMPASSLGPDYFSLSNFIQMSK